SLRRRHLALHHAGLSLPRDRRALHQFSPAALDALHAGLGLCRARAHEARLCACGGGGLSLLLLRRCLSSLPGARAVSIAFSLIARDGAARRGRMATAHGTVETPAFMAVGTAATVKAMRP